MSTIPDILAAAQSLSAEDRVHLAQAIWDTLSPEQWPHPSEAWIAEVNRRSAALDAGQITTAPWSEVRARARREAGLDG